MANKNDEQLVTAIVMISGAMLLNVAYNILVTVLDFAKWAAISLVKLTVGTVVVLAVAWIAYHMVIEIFAGWRAARMEFFRSRQASRQARAVRKRRQASIEASTFPSFHLIHDPSTLDHVAWNMMTAFIEHRDNSWSQRWLRKLLVKPATIETLREDEVEFDRWRQDYLWEVVEHPVNRSRMNQLYNMIRSLVITELGHGDPSPLTIEIRTKFHTEVLKGRFGDVAAFNEFVAHAHRFREFLHVYGFEILSEMVRLGFVVRPPIVHPLKPVLKRLPVRPQKVLPSSKKRLPAQVPVSREQKQREAAKRQVLQQQQVRQKARAEQLGRQARNEQKKYERGIEAAAKERAEKLAAEMQLRQQLSERYLRGRKPEHLYQDVQAGNCWLSTEMEQVLRDHDSNSSLQELGREAFLTFWDDHDLEILELHDERMTATQLNHQEIRAIEDLIRDAMAVFRKEQAQHRNGEYVAVHPKFGYLLEVAWGRIHREVAGSDHDPEQYLERTIRELVDEVDGMERYCGASVFRALRDCEAFRQQDLAYAYLVESDHLTPGSDRSVLIQKFVAEQETWLRAFREATEAEAILETLDLWSPVVQETGQENTNGLPR